MAKNKQFSENTILDMSWQEAFELAKLCYENAERLYSSAKLLNKNNFHEQTFNNLYIACEEYYKAINFETISFIKLNNNQLNICTLKSFVKEFCNHEYKFREVFSKIEFDIPNLTIKTQNIIDDTQIQVDYQNSIMKTLERLNQINPFSTKNNSLYVGYDSQNSSVTYPKKVVSSKLVNDMLNFCALVKLHCQVLNKETPTGKLSTLIGWHSDTEKRV